MKTRIFEFAILLHPTEDEEKAGAVTQMLVEPTTVLAADVDAANILAARKIPDAHLERLDRIEIAVRPF